MPPLRNTSFWNRYQADLASPSQNEIAPKRCCATTMQVTARNIEGRASASAPQWGGGPATAVMNTAPEIAAHRRRAPASPSSEAILHDTTDVGLNISVATVPSPMSVPICSIKRGLVPMTEASATIRYHASATNE